MSNQDSVMVQKAENVVGCTNVCRQVVLCCYVVLLYVVVYRSSSYRWKMKEGVGDCEMSDRQHRQRTGAGPT